MEGILIFTITLIVYLNKMTEKTILTQIKNLDDKIKVFENLLKYNSNDLEVTNNEMLSNLKEEKKFYEFRLTKKYFY